MIKTERLTIGEHAWTCTQFTGTKSLDVLYSLFSAFGPSLAAMAGGNGSKVEAADLTVAVQALVSKFASSQGVQDLVFKLLANTTVDNRGFGKDVFDDVFAGPSIADLLPALNFVIRTNYGDFWQAAAMARNIIGRTAEPAAPVVVPPAS